MLEVAHTKKEIPKNKQEVVKICSLHRCGPCLYFVIVLQTNVKKYIFQ